MQLSGFGLKTAYTTVARQNPGSDRGIIIVGGKTPKSDVAARGIVIGIRPQTPASDKGIIIVGGSVANAQLSLAQRGIIIVGGKTAIR